MTRITLAYPFEGHDPDDTVDVDETTARTLIRDGRARPAAETSKRSTRQTSKTSKTSSTGATEQED